MSVNASGSAAADDVELEARGSGFFSTYLRTLKSPDVEEPVDVWLHRPAAFLLARAAMPLRAISPNVITVVGMALGSAALAAMLIEFPAHMLVAGLMWFASTVFDCADGQLARMRGTSSAFGRMLDGAADTWVGLSAVLGSAVAITRHYSEPIELAVVLALVVAATWTTRSHLFVYDHYKNLYLKMTVPGYRDAEDLEAVEKRGETIREGRIWARLAYPLYYFFVREQTLMLERLDPHTTCKLGSLPEYDAERAAIYRKHCLAPLKWWRALFGMGSLMFGFTVFTAVDGLEWYLVLRLVGLNAALHLLIMPMQRRASERAFAEMAGADRPVAAVAA